MSVLDGGIGSTIIQMITFYDIETVHASQESQKSIAQCKQKQHFWYNENGWRCLLAKQSDSSPGLISFLYLPLTPKFRQRSGSITMFPV